MIVKFFQHDIRQGLVKYIGRMIPLVLVLILVRPRRYVFPVVWAGILLSIIWYIGVVFRYPVWRHGRLFGPFSSPNSLACLLLLFIPVALFGIIRYRQSCPKGVIAAGFLTIAALAILVCTGSPLAPSSCWAWGWVAGTYISSSSAKARDMSNRRCWQPLRSSSDSCWP